MSCVWAVAASAQLKQILCFKMLRRQSFLLCRLTSISRIEQKQVLKFSLIHVTITFGIYEKSCKSTQQTHLFCKLKSVQWRRWWRISANMSKMRDELNISTINWLQIYMCHDVYGLQNSQINVLQKFKENESIVRINLAIELWLTIKMIVNNSKCQLRRLL